MLQALSVVFSVLRDFSTRICAPSGELGFRSLTGCSIGVFQATYEASVLSYCSLSEISWIFAFQSCLR
jgi:hypothetical protein